MKYPLHQSAALRSPALCCFVLIAIPLLTSAQQPGRVDAAGDQATIQSLLAEVRQLRIALERSASLLPRIQLATQRLQGQQDRVDRLSRELRDFRNQMAQHAAERERVAGRLQQNESEIGQTQDLNRHKETEAAMKVLSAELVHHTAREQQERAQEVELLSQLQSEQFKLNDLSDQLNALDKQLQPEPKTLPQR